MGYAIARAAIEAGATVTLITGPAALDPPQRARVVRVESARQMLDAVNAQVNGADVFIAGAAVADYYVANSSPQKIKKEGGVPSLQLALNPDSVDAVPKRANPPFCGRFAAQSDKHAENPRAQTPR